MLEKVDLTKKLPKKEYKKLLPDLRTRLYDLQKASWDAQVPVVIIFEGWDAAGKGTAIQTLTARLDPRGFKLYPIREARTYEKKRPWLWRFWLKLPARGEWAIFDRSWYGRVLIERVEELTSEREWRRAYRDIVDLERTIADDGYLIVKFFLHIRKREQKLRFKKLLKDPLTAWQVQAEDWEHYSKYDEYALAVEEMLERTDTQWGPWTIVEATNRRYTQVKIFQTLIAALEERLATIPGAWPAKRAEKPPVTEPAVETIAEEVPAEVTAEITETPLAETALAETLADEPTSLPASDDEEEIVVPTKKPKRQRRGAAPSTKSKSAPQEKKATVEEEVVEVAAER